MSGFLPVSILPSYSSGVPTDRLAFRLFRPFPIQIRSGQIAHLHHFAGDIMDSSFFMNHIRLLATASLATGIFWTSTLFAQSAVEHWLGTATVHQQEVPVFLDLSHPDQDGKISGSFINGGHAAQSSSGQLTGNHLVLNFDYFARKLEGDFHQQIFTGTYSGTRGRVIPIKLHLGRGFPQSDNADQSNARQILGDWEIAVHSPKGESA